MCKIIIFTSVVMCLVVSAAAQAVQLKATNLKRWDLPDEFAFGVLEAKYAVVKVWIKNETGSVIAVDPDKIAFSDGKKRQLENHPVQRVTPEVLKTPVFKAVRDKGVHGEAGGPVYGRAGDPRGYPYPGIGGGPEVRGGSGGPGVRSLETANALVEMLERNRLAKRELAAGEEIEGFLYVKVRKDNGELASGNVTVQLADGKALTARID